MADTLEREFDELASTTLAANVKKSATAADADVVDEIKKVRQICTTQDLNAVASGNSMKTLRPAVVHGIIRALSEKARGGSPSADSIVARMRVLVRLVYLKMALLRVTASEATTVSMQQLIDEMVAVLAEGGSLSQNPPASKPPLPQAADEDGGEDHADFTAETKTLLGEVVDFFLDPQSAGWSFDNLKQAFVDGKSPKLNELDLRRIDTLFQAFDELSRGNSSKTYATVAAGLDPEKYKQYNDFILRVAVELDKTPPGNAQGKAPPGNAQGKAQGKTQGEAQGKAQGKTQGKTTPGKAQGKAPPVKAPPGNAQGNAKAKANAAAKAQAKANAARDFEALVAGHDGNDNEYENAELG